MNTPLIIQNSATSIVVYLELETGDPATGLAAADVTGGIKKNGAGSFSVFTLSGSNFTELTDGFYEVDLAAGNTDTLGNLYLSFTGRGIKTALVVAYVTTGASAAPIPTPAFTPTVTEIFGYVYGPTGSPVENARVVARMTQLPTVIHPNVDGVLISSDLVTTSTDSTGYFSLSLLTGASFEFFITDANYRRTVTIPGVSTNLFDIP